jgi:hypothetical protein
MGANVIEIDLSLCEGASPGGARRPGPRSEPCPRGRRRQRPSIRRNGANEDYKAQDLPFAIYPARPGVVYRAGTEVGGQRCPRCTTYIAVTSKVMRLKRRELGKCWVHERCLVRRSR